MTFKHHILTFSFLLAALAVQAGAIDLPEPVLSFENGTGTVVCGRGSMVGTSDMHSKLGESSLLWQWRKKGASIEIPGEIPYLGKNPDPKETSVSSFVFWIYSDTPMAGKMRFSFHKGDRECCHFTYEMNFTGWRGAWVAFDRDMQGTPEEGMDRIVITAPEGIKKGRVYIDGLIPASFQDVRYHTPDWQAPFINEATTSHWLVLTKNWDLKLDIAQEPISQENIEEMSLIRDRFVKLVTKDQKIKSPEELRKAFDSYGIRYNNDGSIKGKPIFFTRYGETYINIGMTDVSRRWSANGQLLRAANDFMFQLAVAYLNTEDEALRNEYASMYVEMTRHMIDQGFVAGSGLGTLHHLGYSMRNFYTGPVIMRKVLEEAGLAKEMQRAMEWFSGVGEVKVAPKELGMDIDAFNTSLMGRTASLLMMEDTPYKYAYIKALSRWIDNGFKYTEGLKSSFKRDGSVIHHKKSYPAYATGGMDGGVKAVWILARTSLAVSQESHEILKKALLEMRFYCNKKSFPLAMSGRHPDGKGALVPMQYALLADAGSPDGSRPVDEELAEAYLRINGNKGDWAEQFIEAGLAAEKAPTGTHVYPFNCSMTHRDEEWSVTLAGHSRYLWAAETYQGENLYGRYLAHGSMQILADRVPDISSFDSGYKVEGYDWRYIPGTTAAAVPMEDMHAIVLNVDEHSGYEEMLLSDEWFAGGVSHRGNSGVYAMKLHEHDKYNGSLRARKSYFCDGNRIVAIGTDIQNAIDAEVNTTLFQNSLEESAEFCSGTYEGPLTVLKDRFGNAYLVSGSKVELRRGIQNSFHEETAAPTSAAFERAYISHGRQTEGGSYEYLTLIHPEQAQLEQYTDALPYRVLQKDNNAHVISFDNGLTCYAVFESSRLPGLVSEATESLIMYSTEEDGSLLLSVCNPDLALYAGASDEIFDAEGKRKERSVYGRKWIDNPCEETTVELTLNGEWTLLSDNSSFSADVREGMTVVRVTCREAVGEEVRLARK